MFGFSGLAATMWILSGLNLDVAPRNISWPLVLNGFSMGFIFVPMTTLAMATLPHDQIYQSTGLYSLMRNIGGSLGISMLITLQSRASQAHQAVMVSHMTPYDFPFQQQMQRLTGSFMGMGIGSVRAAQMAGGSLYGSLVKQSMLLSFMDSFRLLAILCVLCIPTVFLFKKVKGGREVLAD
jgi:DHA2 family multidrug resistance protein